MHRTVSPSRHPEQRRRVVSPVRGAQINTLRSMENIKRIEHVIFELGKAKETLPPPPPPAVRAMHTTRGIGVKSPKRPLRNLLPTAMCQPPESPVYESDPGTCRTTPWSHPTYQVGNRNTSISPRKTLYEQIVGGGASPGSPRSPSPVSPVGSPVKLRQSIMGELAAEWQQRALEMQNKLIEHRHSVANHKDSISIESKNYAPVTGFNGNHPPPSLAGNSVHTADIHDLVGLDELQNLAIEKFTTPTPLRYDVHLKQQAEHLAATPSPESNSGSLVYVIEGTTPTDAEALDAAIAEWGTPDPSRTHVGVAISREEEGKTVVAAVFSP